MQKPINEASAKELRYHAETVLGLEPIPVSANRGMIIAKIEAAVPGTTVVQVPDEVESPAQTTAVANSAAAAIVAEQEKVEAARQAQPDSDRFAGMSAKQAAQHHHDPRIDVMIASTPEKGGDRAVPVSVNGVQYTVKRDEWVTVPYRIFEALKHAVETKYEHSNNDIGHMQVSERSVFSYPFSTRNEPSEAEVEAWRLRTESVELA